MNDPYEGWVILELMGHRRLAGFVTEQEIAGQAFVRLDIAGPAHPEDDEDDGPAVAPKGGFEGGITQFYGPQAIYCLTPTTQDIAVRLGRQLHPAPVQRFELEPRRAAPEDAFTVSDCLCTPGHTCAECQAEGVFP